MHIPYQEDVREMHDYVLALDGGSTTTQIALADRNGAVVQFPASAGVNPMDNRDWLQEFELSLNRSQFTDRSITYAVLGLPGYGEIDAITTMQEEAVQTLCPFSYEIMNDAELAFKGAFLDGPGILILSGTGSMAIGRDEHDNWIEVGGWGEGFGDEGGAYWIGREAIARASWVLDGRLDDETFAEAILNATGAKQAQNPFKLMDWYYNLKHPRSEVAALTPVVDALARESDKTAMDILTLAAEHLNHHLNAARRRLSAEPMISWSFAGNVFNCGFLRTTLADLQGIEPACPKLSSLGGGLWIAANEAEWQVSSDWVKQIADATRTGA